MSKHSACKFGGCATSKAVPQEKVRKIIHIDMDCFYAAIEERDHPELRGHPVGVGGRSRRGVLTTANYEARKFGCRSAMPVFMALEKCPHLLIVPTRFEVYQRDSARIRKIFRHFTPLVEPLSLDEAFLDVSHHAEPATRIATRIREWIRQETGLTASAGIAPNKLIAKIASDWRKPDGQFTVPPAQVEGFMQELPLKKIPGVGRKMAARLGEFGVETCGEYRAVDKFEWVRRLGAAGAELYQRCWGRDDRPVVPHSPRKSLSIENTFSENLESMGALEREMGILLEELAGKLAAHHAARQIRALVVTLKFADFRRTTAERAHPVLDHELFRQLLEEANSRSQDKPVRLLGVGVRFFDLSPSEQLELELQLPEPGE